MTHSYPQASDLYIQKKTELCGVLPQRTTGDVSFLLQQVDVTCSYLAAGCGKHGPMSAPHNTVRTHISRNERELVGISQRSDAGALRATHVTSRAGRRYTTPPLTSRTGGKMPLRPSNTSSGDSIIHVPPTYLSAIIQPPSAHQQKQQHKLLK